MTDNSDQNQELLKIPKNNIETCISNFTKFLLEKSFDQLQKTLISLSSDNLINTNLFRSTSWKILLGALPIEKVTIKQWYINTKDQRKQYSQKLSYFKSKQIDEKDEKWGEILEEKDLKNLINLDVTRTFQQYDLFTSQKIKDMLSNILFIWSREHLDPSYRQGMNDILAILLIALYPFYTTQYKYNEEDFDTYISKPIKYNKEIYSYFHDENQLENDLYTLFTLIMDKGLSQLYESTSEKSAVRIKEKNKEETISYLHYRCKCIIDIKLKLYDKVFYQHMTDIGLDLYIVLPRWIKCLFNREFSINEVLVLWDAILTYEYSSEEKMLSFIDYLSLSLLNNIKFSLMNRDQDECFQMLFSYPPNQNMQNLVKNAIKIRGVINQSDRKGKMVKKIKKLKSIKAIKSNKPEKIKSVNTISGFLKFYNNPTELLPSDTNQVEKEEIKEQKEKKENINFDMSNRKSISRIFRLHNTISEDNKETLNQIDLVFKKYTQLMENVDRNRLEFLIDQLKKSI